MYRCTVPLPPPPVPWRSGPGSEETGVSAAGCWTPRPASCVKGYSHWDSRWSAVWRALRSGCPGCAAQWGWWPLWGRDQKSVRDTGRVGARLWGCGAVWVDGTQEPKAKNCSRKLALLLASRSRHLPKPPSGLIWPPQWHSRSRTT